MSAEVCTVLSSIAFCVSTVTAAHVFVACSDLRAEMSLRACWHCGAERRCPRCGAGL